MKICTFWEPVSTSLHSVSHVTMGKKISFTFGVKQYNMVYFTILFLNIFFWDPPGYFHPHIFSKHCCAATKEGSYCLTTKKIFADRHIFGHMLPPYVQHRSTFSSLLHTRCNLYICKSLSTFIRSVREKQGIFGYYLFVMSL